MRWKEELAYDSTLKQTSKMPFYFLSDTPLKTVYNFQYVQCVYCLLKDSINTREIL